MMHLRSLPLATFLFAALPALAEEAGPPVGSSELIQRFQITEARQGVGVDADAFYAVDNTVIAKYDKKTGALIAKWEGGAEGSATHLDSATVVDGKLYAAHSNYPAWPMTSSIEIWDAATMKHSRHDAVLDVRAGNRVPLEQLPMLRWRQPLFGAGRSRMAAASTMAHHANTGAPCKT